MSNTTTTRRRRRTTAGEEATAVTESLPDGTLDTVPDDAPPPTSEASGIPNVAIPEPPPEIPMTLPRVKKRDWCAVIEPSLTPLLCRWPGNDTARAMLSSKLEVAIPPEADTWDKIVAWLEYDAIIPAEERARLAEEERLEKLKSRINEPKLTLNAKLMVEEYGTCCYTEVKRGTGQVSMPKSAVQDFLRRSYASEVINDIRSYLREEIPSQVPTHGDGEELRHSDYEENDDSPNSRDYNFTDERTIQVKAIKDFIQSEFPDWWREHHMNL